jgi:hypothetical protein
MKTTKLIALAALVPLFAGVTQAQAATKKKKPPKPACFLINDAKGDATGTGTGTPGPNDPNLDLMSVDVASNASQLSAVFRLDALDATDNYAPTGRAFDVAFTVAGTSQNMRTYVYPGGITPPTGGTASIVAASKELHVTVPLSYFGKVSVKPGTKLTNLQASSWRYVANAPVTLGVVDQAAGNAVYVAGYPSCVKVGS